MRTIGAKYYRKNSGKKAEVQTLNACRLSHTSVAANVTSARVKKNVLCMIHALAAMQCLGIIVIALFLRCTGSAWRKGGGLKKISSGRFDRKNEGGKGELVLT